MMDDLEFTAFSQRARDFRGGGFRMPDARTLGRRLTALRTAYGLSIADVADAAGLRHSTVEEFEEYGAASAETVLWLIEILCEDDRLGHAFERPWFSDRAGLLARSDASANVVPLRR